MMTVHQDSMNDMGQMQDAVPELVPDTISPPFSHLPGQPTGQRLTGMSEASGSDRDRTIFFVRPPHSHSLHIPTIVNRRINQGGGLQSGQTAELVHWHSGLITG